jgi:hypothetical protein
MWRGIRDLCQQSTPSPLYVMGQRTEPVPEEGRVQVLEEEPLDEFASAARTDLLEDVAQMVVYRVFGDEKRPEDARGGQAAKTSFAISSARGRNLQAAMLKNEVPGVAFPRGEGTRQGLEDSA